ncbi:hypothetical protein DFH08DRAFT_309101 [Mycena albidolilacea]|uniref:Uncharacterized protein n=1 Tax=Mycena albidolilacea TaxID=1033008 RepID=A0AAD6ZP59_9AGAR|nr:hypothetical protein DFH08DRAFT_309101 [Mycena albidolilacea]
MIAACTSRSQCITAGGDCSLRLDTSTWNNTTKDGIKQFALDTDISNTLAASITTQSNICFSLPFSLGAAPLSLPSAPFPRSTQPPTPSQRPQARNLTHVGPLLPQKLRAELRSSFLLFHLPWRQRRGSDQPDLRRSATPLPTQQLHYEVEVGANASTGWEGLGFRIGREDRARDGWKKWRHGPGVGEEDERDEGRMREAKNYVR